MLDPSMSQAILKAVDDAFDAQIAFTQELVRHPSLRGAEQTVQDFIARAYRKRGLAVDRWTIEPDAIRHMPGFAPVAVSYENAINVVGSYRPARGGGRSLILNGHVDVVPTGPAERWQRPPFDPRVENGWLYGRGAGDMKAGHAASLFAFDAVLAAGFRPRGEIHLQSVVEEECTGNGALACVARGYQADCVFIPEPFTPKLMRAQVGPLWFTITVAGDPQHASGFQSGGSNAIEKAFLVWEGLKRLEQRRNAPESRHPLYKDEPHPIRFNLGKISGGEWASSVPSSCVIEARAAVYPGESPAQACAAIEAAIAEVAAGDAYLSGNPPVVGYHGFMADGFVVENAEQPEAILADSHRAVFGTAIEEHVSPAATDGRYMALIQDTPIIVYGPVCEGAHAFNERVDLQSVRDVTKTMALFIAEWCGIEPA